MAVQQTQMLPAPFLTDVTKQYAADIGALTATPFSQQQLQGMGPQVAGQDPLQAQAYTAAQQGIGAYQPYLTGQGSYAGTPTNMMGVQDYLGQAAGYSGPGAYQQFMSPYQQQVIDKTLTEFDKQTQAGLSGIGQKAAMSGNLGGGREGVMRSEYQSNQDAKRALMHQQMLQQGFTQANQLANQAFGQQRNLAQDISGLGGLQYKLQGQDVSRLGSAGAIQQAQAQAEADALRERNRMAAYEPYERLGYLGSGLSSMLAGMPGGYQTQVTPNKSPLEQALGILSTGTGAYKAFTDN
jgi:hypothetical protein